MCFLKCVCAVFFFLLILNGFLNNKCQNSWMSVEASPLVNHQKSHGDYHTILIVAPCCTWTPFLTLYSLSLSVFIVHACT